MTKDAIKPRLLFITKDANGVAARYRATDYIEQLNKANWNTSQWPASGGLKSIPALIRASLNADIALIQREMVSTAMLCLIKLFNHKLIYDFDDAVFLYDDGTYSKWRSKRFSRIAQTASLMLAGNHYLAEQAKRFNQHVSVLPTTVRISKYQQAHRYKRQNPSQIDLVWIGSSWTRKYLEKAIPALEQLGQKHPDIRLKIIADFDLPMKHITTVPIQWDGQTEAIELATSDIGIAPMVDDLWTRGKCALKVIQYMAAGLPVVSSNVGVNKEVVIDGETGLLADTNEQWIAALDKLIQNKGLRQSMATKGFERASRYYSQEYGFSILLDNLNELLARKP